jgi:hypothetical protein
LTGGSENLVCCSFSVTVWFEPQWPGNIKRSGRFNLRVLALVVSARLGRIRAR